MTAAGGQYGLWPDGYAQDAVCALEPMDGAPSIAGGAGMNAPANGQGAAKAAQMARKGAKNGAKTRAKRCDCMV